MTGNTKEKILVVDDEDLVRWSICRYLQMEGFEVFSASKGPEALAIIAKEPIRILITDLMMPEMDGIELIRQTLTLRPEASILVVTAGTGPMVRSAREAGALMTFMKPVSFPELVSTIQKIV